MTVKYACTFEFAVSQPITHTGTIAASSMPTCFARAARAAARAHPGLRWSSMVVVLLERLDDVESADEPAQEEDAGATSVGIGATESA